MKKQIVSVETQKQIDLAAEQFANILIQQVQFRKNNLTNIQIENKYGKSN